MLLVLTNSSMSTSLTAPQCWFVNSGILNISSLYKLEEGLMQVCKMIVMFCFIICSQPVGVRSDETMQIGKEHEALQ